MKPIVLSLLILSISLSVNAGVECACHFLVGIPELPNSYQSIVVSAKMPSKETAYTTTTAELNIVASYQCFKQKEDIRKIIDLTDVRCELK